MTSHLCDRSALKKPVELLEFWQNITFLHKIFLHNIPRQVNVSHGCKVLFEVEKSADFFHATLTLRITKRCFRHDLAQVQISWYVGNQPPSLSYPNTTHTLRLADGFISILLYAFFIIIFFWFASWRCPYKGTPGNLTILLS